MASPDPIAAERAHYLALLGLTVDDPAVTLSQLRAMTGAGVDARNAAEAKITEQKMVAGSAFVRSVNGIIPDITGNVTVAGGGGSSDWSSISNKPATFPPDAHSHPISGVTSLQSILDGKSATGHGHAIADVTGLQGTLDGKSPTGHGHVISDVTNLQSTLDGKAATVHTHTIANVTNLQSTLDGKAATAHSHAIADTTGLQSALDGKSATGHTHTIANTTGLQAALDSKAASTHSHGAADLSGVVKTVNGTAPDGSGNVTVSGGGGGSNWSYVPTIPYVGRWYTSSSAGLSAGRGFPAEAILVPFLCPFNFTADRIGIGVSTVDATTNVRLGIYNSRTDGMPGTVLLDAGTVGVATLGEQSIVISQALTKGTLYWLITTATVNSNPARGYGISSNAQYGGSADIGRSSLTSGYAADGIYLSRTGGVGDGNPLVDLTSRNDHSFAGGYAMPFLRVGSV